MIPKCGLYFGEELYAMRQDQYFRVDLTIAGHSCQHDILYRVFGDKRDKLARDGLAGLIGKEEIVAELTKLSRRFSGKTHSEESKKKVSATLQNKLLNDPQYREWQTKNGKRVGASKHKRNPAAATLKMSGPNKHQYMRRHWKKDVWDALEEAWNNRSGKCWGRESLTKSLGVSKKTVEKMLYLIKQGVDWDTATTWEGGK
jgi:hypothetical protein